MRRRGRLNGETPAPRSILGTDNREKCVDPEHDNIAVALNGLEPAVTGDQDSRSAMHGGCDDRIVIWIRRHGADRIALGNVIG